MVFHRSFVAQRLVVENLSNAAKTTANTILEPGALIYRFDRVD